MKVAAVRFTRRWNHGNYEHSELSVETIPDDGQTAEDLLTATRQFVEAQRPGSNLAPVSNGKPSSAPPLAKKDDMVPALEQSIAATKAAEPAPDKPKRGRPSKAQNDARAAVRLATEAKNLEDFLECIQEARQKAAALPLDEWDRITAANGPLAAKYRELNSIEADPATVNTIVAALKSERQAIADKQAATAA